MGLFLKWLSDNGDIISLAALLWKVDFSTSVKGLLSLSEKQPLSFSFSGQTHSSGNGIEIYSVSRLNHPALITYVESRGISSKLAKAYLNEVVYHVKGKRFFAVGFKNDNGGYELRNGLGFKGGKTINGISTFERNTQSVAIFEGFFDFLSAMEHYKREQPLYTTIVLNTCNNIRLALPLLTNRYEINCFLDNDETGRKTLERLKNEGFRVKDWSGLLYPNCNDFNDYLLYNRSRKVMNG